MDVRNCRKCGRIFNYVVGLPLCQVCKESMEKKFQEVKEYIREHKGVGITEVAEACEVERSQITQWLREERLEFSEESNILLPCEGCGAQIKSGKYCDKCKAEMVNGFKSVTKKEAPIQEPVKKSKSTDTKMRYL